MILVDGEKYACEQCIRGHRSSICKHIRRPLVLVRARGRPLTDSFQRIAIYAEEIHDEDEKRKALENNDNSKNNLLVAKSIKFSHQPSSSCCGSKKKNEIKTANETENITVKIENNKDEKKLKDEVEVKVKKENSTVSPSPELVSKPQKSSCCSKQQKPQVSSCCSNKKDKVTKPKKSSCKCCVGISCNKNSSPVYILKASKRQVFNVDKNSLRLLDPVVEIPNSKVGLDIIERVSRSKHKNSSGQKLLAQQLDISLDKDKLNNSTKRLIPKSGGDIIQFQVKKQENDTNGVNGNINSNDSPSLQQKTEYVNKLLNSLNEDNNPTSDSNSNFNLVQNDNSNALSLADNGFLYDLYIANTCTVPGSCLCPPDQCNCEGCTEHIKYKNSNLSIKQQFDEFPFPSNDNSSDYFNTNTIQKQPNSIMNNNVSNISNSLNNLPEVDSLIGNGNNLNDVLSQFNNSTIKPYGKVEIQSSIPQFEQTFFNKLYQDLSSTKNDNNNNNDLMTSPVDEIDECFCDPNHCCCFNCVEHGIINGIRISDGLSVITDTNLAVNIQLTNSQFPLNQSSVSSSPSISTQSVISPDFTGNQLDSLGSISNSNSVLNPELETIMNSNLSDRNKWQILHQSSRMVNKPQNLKPADSVDSTNTTSFNDANNLFFNNNLPDLTRNSPDSLIPTTESVSVSDINMSEYMGTTQHLNQNKTL